MIVGGALFFLGLLCPALSFADQSVETFSSRANFQSGTAVWNQGLGKAHPTLRVMNFKAGFTPFGVDVGDGSHGVFDSSTYASFSVGGDVTGNIIRFDTNTHPTLQVTNFILEAGWTLVPQGSLPLKIYSQSDVIVRGEIWCHGGNGANGVGATPGVGGTGRCGGRNGGDGGAPTTNGSSGGNALAATVTGGQGGNFTGAAAVGGGGGGSWNLTSTAGNAPGFSGAGGTGGSSVSDPEFTNELGSSGGGGGSGTNTDAGAGGGAGGGLVIIHAARNFELGTAPTSTTGFIFASGGSGGSSNVPGGPGGGGGGGSIRVFVGSGINIYNTDGTGASRAEAGAGGTNSLAVAGPAGGSGRSWFSSVTYNTVGTGFYTPAEEAPVTPGNVEFSSASQQVTTKTLDLGSTILDLQSVATTPVSGDFQISLNGSSDNFVLDSTGWTTTLSDLVGKRYIQIRATITTSNVNSPTMLDAVTLTYTLNPTPKLESNFNFASAGCGTIAPPSSNGKIPWWLLLMTLGLPFGTWLGLRAKTQNQIGL